MKIVILGAGQVGTTAATQLASEPNNDITLVDTNAALLRELQEKLDIRTVTGLASHPSVLAAAGVDDADMLLAVTHSDEVNMVACQLAWKLFHTPVKIARLRAPEYKENASIFEAGYFHIDVIISPETLIQEHIARLVAYPGPCRCLISPAAGCAWSACARWPAGRWWVIRSATSASTCPTSTPAWRRSFAGGRRSCRPATR